MSNVSKPWNFQEALENFNNKLFNRKLFLEVKERGNSVQMELSVTPFPITGPEYKGGIIVKESSEDGFAFQHASETLINQVLAAASYGFEKIQELPVEERHKILL